MKRGRSDTLTGGSRDVNPQILATPAVIVPATVGLNVFSHASIPISLPISRLPARGTKATIIELLKVYFDLPSLTDEWPTGSTTKRHTVLLSTSDFGQNVAQNTSVGTTHPSILAFGQLTARGAFTAGGSYATSWTEPLVVDLTDGAGHGVLIATDTIYLTGQTSNGSTAIALHSSAKLLYRFKEVGLTEYIGIVQSQTST